jgi:replicative DNA helicase
MIKKIKVELNEENKILSHIIANSEFLGQIRKVIDPKYFKSSMARMISEWVLEFYDSFERAPYKNIKDLYMRKRKEIQDEEETELIAEYLSNLSRDWEQAAISNLPYTVKQAIHYFKIRSLELIKDNIDYALTQDNPALGERYVSEFSKVEKQEGHGIDLLKDSSAIASAFDTHDEILFKLPGALGEVIGDFVRGDFVAIMGPSKRGKTWWMWYIGYRAALLGLKIVFFSLEMTEKRIIRRQWQTLQGLPLQAGKINIPYFQVNDDGKYLVKNKVVQKDALPVDEKEIEQQLKKYRMNLKSGQIKTVVYPSYEATVEDIETALVNFEYYENFVPDVIVVDYADILKPTASSDYRHQIDAIWKSLRGMAQKWDACVVTGSQTDRKSQQGEVKSTNIAEDIRKIAHVTKLITKQQRDYELENGYCRIESLAQREGKKYAGSAYVLECLEIARPYIDSKKDSEMDESLKKVK